MGRPVGVRVPPSAYQISFPTFSICNYSHKSSASEVFCFQSARKSYASILNRVSASPNEVKTNRSIHQKVDCSIAKMSDRIMCDIS
jgi:hypothetical protein